MIDNTFYSDLSNLRELFHKFGNFDDSNAKLDEISKYISIYIYQIQTKDLSPFSFKELKESFKKDNSFGIVKKLKELFKEVADKNLFKDTNGVSIFGNQPMLNINDNDNEFAFQLVDLVINGVDKLLKQKEDYNFDLLNESFGHFVRDNFRNNVEDAQYMTPPEVVEFMCEIALNDIGKNNGDNFVVCDPCCGVGSFLSVFYQKNKEKKKISNEKVKILGQDKVSRMARLSKINMVLFNNNSHIINNGNSLSGKSVLDEYTGKVDLILTNPPFGAKFKSSDLKEGLKQKYPILFDVIQNNKANFSSEVLFIDRCISLLKEGGILLAVVPDSVISSAGLNDTLRQRLAHNKAIHVKAIIELPAVTFAQAGTRTKTSIIYLEKIGDIKSREGTFIAQSKDLGFEVSSKKGSTVKYTSGINDLTSILTSYQNVNWKLKGKINNKIIRSQPSCVIINTETLKEQSWTPNHYSASKYEAINSLKSNKEYDVVKLSEIVNFETKKRRKLKKHPNSKCISVLHVTNDDNLNYEDLLTYAPKYKGISCQSGDLLFSKINPRILRLLIVPNLAFPLTCSSEFEIINSTTYISNYGLKLLLMLPSVQTQIQFLTSGTSSSHNRIKTKDLANVLIPLPKENTKSYDRFIKEIKDYEQDSKNIGNLRFEVFNKKNKFFSLFD